MPNAVCWSCDALAQHEIVGQPSVQTKAMGTDRSARVCAVFAAYKCVSCECIAIAIRIAYDYDLPNRNSLQAWLEDDPDELIWKPDPGLSRSYHDVPDHISGAAQEAFECQSRGYHRAAILLARAVIEATAKDKQITTGNLKDKIKKLNDNEWIRTHIMEGADSVRLLGNDMAHGDFVQPVTAEESGLVIAIMEEILAEVYQSRAKVERARAAVVAREQQQH